MAKINCNVISYVLQRAVDLTVIIPTVSIPETMNWNEKKPSHAVKAKFPVLYLLHGMGNNHATWCGYSNIELFAEERNIAVVMFSGENKFYRTVPGGDDYDRFIEEELPEFITNMFPVSECPSDTYIAGLSMGGAGALMHGLKNPEKYAAVGALSAAISCSENQAGGWDGPKLPDPRTIVSEIKKENRRFPAIYLACGEKDFMYEENFAFQNFLKEENLPVTWVSAPDYMHEWRFWNWQIEQFLDWLPRTDYYASLGKRMI